jgi:hypothetical protein
MNGDFEWLAISCWLDKPTVDAASRITDGEKALWYT